MTREIHTPVIVHTIQGRFEGVIVGRSFMQDARYDVRTREGYFTNIPEAQIKDVPVRKGGNA